MRVLMVSELMPPVRGGLEFHVARLTAALTERGHEVQVATLTDDPTAQAGPVHSLPSLVRYLPHEDPARPFALPVSDPLAASRLQRVVRSFRPDVVHGHNWLASSLPLHRGHRPPLVVTAHDYALVCALRTLYDADGRICSGPAPVKCLRCAARAMDPVRSAVIVPATVVGRRRLRPDAVIAVSRAVADAIGPHLDRPVDVVENFVAPEPPAEPLPASFPAGTFALFAGDAAVHKGIDDVLDAWAQERPGGLGLVVATTRALHRATSPHVHVVELTPGQMVTAWQRAAVALAPSRWPDPLPTVVLEAFRAGTPVVATASGGLAELVVDGRTGLRVPRADPVAIATAVARIAGDDALRARLGEGAREAAGRYGADRLVGRVVDVYERVAARTPA